METQHDENAERHRPGSRLTGWARGSWEHADLIQASVTSAYLRSVFCSCKTWRKLQVGFERFSTCFADSDQTVSSLGFLSKTKNKTFGRPTCFFTFACLCCSKCGENKLQENFFKRGICRRGSVTLHCCQSGNRYRSFKYKSHTKHLFPTLFIP